MIRRTTKAILNLYDDVITWPDADERELISQRIEELYEFPHLVGIIDGTLFPLAIEPSVAQEDYFTRKGGNALTSLIVCDDVGRIRHYELGYPGSVHDNRMWKNSSLFLQKDFFSQNCNTYQVTRHSKILK